VRPNRGLLERTGPDKVETLAGENVEVVEPERGHHFLQLARPFDRAHHPRLDRFAHHDSLLDSRVLGRVLERRFVAADVLGLRILARLHDRPLIFDEQRDWSHAQRVKVVDALGQIGRNCDRLGMQLFVHVALRANRTDVLEVPGRGPKASRLSTCRIRSCLESSRTTTGLLPIYERAYQRIHSIMT